MVPTGGLNTRVRHARFAYVCYYHHGCSSTLTDSLFKLDSEPTLIPSRMAAMDGNNSAKRFASAGLQDMRVFESDYFLSPEEVDVFKDEVSGRMDAITPTVCSSTNILFPPSF